MTFFCLLDYKIFFSNSVSLIILLKFKFYIIFYLTCLLIFYLLYTYLNLLNFFRYHLCIYYIIICIDVFCIFCFFDYFWASQIYLFGVTYALCLIDHFLWPHDTKATFWVKRADQLLVLFWVSIKLRKATLHGSISNRFAFSLEVYFNQIKPVILNFFQTHAPRIQSFSSVSAQLLRVSLSDDCIPLFALTNELHLLWRESFFMRYLFNVIGAVRFATASTIFNNVPSLFSWLSKYEFVHLLANYNSE